MLDEWRRLALDVLRKAGRAGPADSPDDVERLLATTTYDGIELAPLYRPGDAALTLPRGARPAGAPWEIRQRHTGPDTVRLRAAVLDDVHHGVTSLWLDLGGTGAEALADLLGGLDPARVTVVVDAPETPDKAAEALLGWAAGHGPGARPRGGLGVDPLGALARNGRSTGAEFVVPLARRCVARAPGLAALTVDATVHHEAGASDADELALSVATGVAYLRTLTAGGVARPDAFGQIEFRYAATADQFATIAKLRAARRLWSRVADVCGVPEAAGQRQHAVTSRAMLTTREPSLNMVRATVAALAAVAGGADALTVHPYDLLRGDDDALARRIARNCQTVLHAEAHLGRVTDPAGGSWYVEAYTEKLAQRAWDRFQEIERRGGMPVVLADGTVAGWLVETWRRRRDDLARRQVPIIGVSRYADPDEPAPPAAPPAVPRRYAADFERLRDRSDRHRAATGARPAVFLLPLGATARPAVVLDAAADLLASAGITALRGASHRTVADSIAAFLASAAPVIVLCGDDPAETVAELVAGLAQAGVNRVWAAGEPASYPGIRTCLTPAELAGLLTDLGVR